MSVTANIETRYRTNVLSVPIQSVTTRLPKGKPGETNVTTTTMTNGAPPKPIEVVFVIEGDHVKMTPVTRGISDDNYVEIISGLKEGQEVVSGGYKAINRDLEDGKKVVVNTQLAGQDKEKTN
jgi:HlyD family secretion protein